ncbi:MAG: ABC transporter permease [Betaproteobacteria bacterium]|nr:ABC transporter permease [Betaproteobacteria bacterium]
MNMNIAVASIDKDMGTLHKRTQSGRWSLGEFSWIWVATAGLFLLSAIVAPGTVTKGSLFAMLPFAGILAIVATGQTVVIQQRGLDMSSAGMVSLAGVLAAIFGYRSDSMVLSVLAATGICAFIGVINGVLIARAHITPLVATLAMNAALIGVVRDLTGNAPVSMPENIQEFSHADLGGLPYSLWLAVLFIFIVAIVTRRTVLGRRFVAVGVNPRTSIAAGINALRYQIGAYLVSAVCFAVAGILLAGYIGNASHTAGNDYLLPAIAAVVVGGTPFTGGRGSVVASGVAALFMAQLSQMVLALGAGSAVQLLVQAAAILLATTIRLAPALIHSR